MSVDTIVWRSPEIRDVKGVYNVELEQSAFELDYPKILLTGNKKYHYG